MAAGRPVICLDQGGPATQVTSESGVKVKVESPEQVITDIAKAMAMFVNSSDLCDSMGRSGRERVATMFTWDHKAAVFNKVYEEVVSR
jgi:glycosyltransferase involved in cell wall biosynthesis